jgi:hypothetical protein
MISHNELLFLKIIIATFCLEGYETIISLIIQMQKLMNQDFSAPPLNDTT